jgi:hypothetical protein
MDDRKISEEAAIAMRIAIEDFFLYRSVDEISEICKIANGNESTSTQQAVEV